MQARPTASNSSPSGRASLPCCGLMGTRSPHAGKRTPMQSQTQGCPRSPCHSHLPRLGSEKARKALVSGARLRMASQTQEVLPSYWPSPGIPQVPVSYSFPPEPQLSLFRQRLVLTELFANLHPSRRTWQVRAWPRALRHPAIRVYLLWHHSDTLTIPAPFLGLWGVLTTKHTPLPSLFPDSQGWPSVGSCLPWSCFT